MTLSINSEFHMDHDLDQAIQRSLVLSRALFLLPSLSVVSSRFRFVPLLPIAPSTFKSS